MVDVRRLARAVVLTSSLAGLLACGGRLVSSAEDASTPDAAVCAPDTVACELPGFAPSGDACFTCASAAICQCRDLNPGTPWQPPADCDFDDAGCSGDGAPPSQHGCQVGAVQMVKCMTSSSHAACSALYFDAHPGAVEPLGMEFALFDCAVCSACAQACAGTPNIAVCQ